MSDNQLRRSNRINRRKCDKSVECNTHLTDDNINEMSNKRHSKRCQSICEKCLKQFKEVLQKSTKRKSNFKSKTCFDSITQKWIKVCDNCAKLMTRTTKLTDISTKVSIEEQKRKYLSNCHSFGLSLVQLLNDSSAERLFCPNIRNSGKACACLQRYVIGSDNDLSSKQQRAQHLLDLLTKAKHLSQQKCYSMSNPKSGQKIGLGNGHKKSIEFENFVNKKRSVLRNDFKFCEKAIQRILFYSNNFLHKKLKTEPNGRQRVDPQKGRASTHRLININSLSNENCCVNRCVQLSQTRPQLLEEWRQRAATGQMEARRVMAEMLTPTQAFRCNCFKFVSLVTGSSIRTISKVNEYLITNGGNREPSEHGLKRFYVINDNKRQTNVSNEEIVSNTSTLNSEATLLLAQNNSSIDCLPQNNRIALLVNPTNNEISVINSGKKQTIAILSQPIDIISGHTLQIPVSITSQVI